MELDLDPRIELRHLRYFVAVAEELHFGRAANRLHIAQPPLSQQIRQLEELIGHKLFERTSRAVNLTSAGRALLDRARRAMARMQEDLSAVRSVGRGEAGSITVGFVGSAMLTPLPAILSHYRRQFPNVHLRLYDYVTTNLVEAIRDGSVHVGFLRDGGSPPDLHTETVWSEPYVAILPRAHPLTARASVPLAKLKHEPFVFFVRSMGTDAWERTMRLFEPFGFRPEIHQEASQWLVVLKLIGAGLGITIAPQCVREIADAGVVWRPLRPRGGTTTIDMAFRADTADPIVKAFAALARRAYAESA